MGWELVHDTYEPGRPFPIVTHVFRGETKAEAEGYYRSHLRSDAFMRQCERGEFRRPGSRGRVDAIVCRVERHWRRF